MVDGLVLLADATLKVTLILALAFAAACLLRGATARVRHGLWAASLVGALLVPVLSVTLPGWSVPLLPPLPGLSSQPEGDGSAGFALPAAPGSAQRGSADLLPAEPEDALIGEVTAGSSNSGSRRGWWSPRIWGLAVLVAWLLGVMLVALRLAHGLGRLRRWTRAAVEAGGPGTRGLLERLLPDLGLRRPVRVLRSEQLVAPITWGWLRPVALLPATSDGWSPERRRIVLLHELIHVRHGDWLVQVAAQLACALYWFHPLLWLAVRRLQVEREQACDESVLARGTRPSEYATHLLEIARAMAPGTAGPALGLSMAQHRQLERRLLTMLNRRRPVHRTFLPVAGAIVLMSALVVSVSAVEPWPVPAPTPPEAPVPSAALPGPAPVAPVSSVPAPTAVPAPDVAAPPATAPGPVAVAAPAVPMSWVPHAAAMPAPVAAPVPTLLAVPAAPASVVNGFRGTIQHGDGSYYRVGHEGSDFVLEKTEGDFKLRLHIEEPDTVEFSRDGSEILRMGRRASVLIRTSTDDAWQRLDITRDSDGDLRYDWTVDGERRDFDDQAREWMSVALQVAHGIREASELRGRQSSLRGQISSIKGQRSSLKGQISSAKGRESSLRGQISSIKGHVSSQRGQASSIQGHVSSLQGQISSIKGHESSLRGQISSLRGQISSLKAQRRSANSDDEEMNRLSAEMNRRIEDKIEDRKVQIREVARQIEDYDAEERIREVELEIEEYDAEARIREVQRELDGYDAESRVREVEREIESLDTEVRIREVEREIEKLDVEVRVRDIEREIEELNADHRAEEIDHRTRPLYDELRRLSRRLD